MKKTWGRVLVFILAVLCSIVLVLPAMAGEGDGSGGGKDQPLALTSSSPADGQKDVTLSGEIKLTFSKNVVYLTVRDNNSRCLALYSQEGKEIPIEVIMADDQVEFDKRRDIVIKPRQELQDGTKYTVKVAPQLKSKSGVTLGKEVVISFTTAGAVAPALETTSSGNQESVSEVAEVAKSSPGARSDPAEQAASSGLATNREQEEGPGNITGSNEEDVSREADQPGKTVGEKETSSKGINTGIVAASAIILVAALAYAIYRKKGKQ